MVEYGRFAQIERLESAGWHVDSETEQFESMTRRQGLIGSPTYLRNPDDGLIYECTGGREQPVDGPYELVEGRPVTYRGGRALFARG